MNLLHLIKKETNVPHRTIFTMASISGMSNAGILAIINSAAGSASQEDTNFRLLVLFIIAMLAFIYTQRFIFNETTGIIEGVVSSLRSRITDKIRRSNLLTIEHLGRANIYSRLTQGTAVVSQSAVQMIAALQSGMMVLFAVFYIATLSMMAFALTLLLIAGGVYIYLSYDKHILGNLEKSTYKEVEFFQSITHTLDGFKEAKLNAARSNDLSARTHLLSEELRDIKVDTGRLFTVNYIFSQSFFYVLLAVMVFLLPRLIPTYTESITEITAAILFIIGPLSQVVVGIPAYSQANFSTMDIIALEDELDRLRSDAESMTIATPLAERFEELRMFGIEFTYRDQQGRPLFSVGPLDLRIKAGEIVFVVGGNGSGKSTFMKLLTALYWPDRGNLAIDSHTVNDMELQSYREMFAAIFGEFHLFDRLYGIRDADEMRVNELLKKLGLDSKTHFADGKFSNIDLSTGQRKRLAMAVALLEDRPIYVFDEWAAEQDPEFRRYFYETLLQDLKGRGKTVIAVTHDDHYFQYADKVVKMDFGKFVPYEA